MFSTFKSLTTFVFKKLQNNQIKFHRVKMIQNNLLVVDTSKVFFMN